MLSLEFLVAQSLRFEFKVHHAHLAARGIYLDRQHTSLHTGIGQACDLEVLNEQWIEVCEILKLARLTDVEFLWTPSQIATAAWWMSDEEGTQDWIRAKAQRMNHDGHRRTGWVEEEVELLMSYLPTLAELLQRARSTPIDKERVTAVDRRLRFCRNPEKDPNSALYKIKQNQVEEQALAKQQVKHLREKVEDPFA